MIPELVDTTLAAGACRAGRLRAGVHPVWRGHRAGHRALAILRANRLGQYRRDQCYAQAGKQRPLALPPSCWTPRKGAVARVAWPGWLIGPDAATGWQPPCGLYRPMLTPFVYLGFKGARVLPYFHRASRWRWPGPWGLATCAKHGLVTFKASRYSSLAGLTAAACRPIYAGFLGLSADRGRAGGGQTAGVLTSTATISNGFGTGRNRASQKAR